VTAELLIAVDGDALLRAADVAFAESTLVDANGVRAHALGGALSLLAGMLHAASPSAVLVAFDSDTSWRSASSSRYQTRLLSEDLVMQRRTLRRVLPACGITVVEIPDFEGADVCASAAARATAAGWVTNVVTDRDLATQLASDSVEVLALPSSSPLPARVVQFLPLGPGRWVELVALRGDPGTNLEGVPGLGPRRAATALSGVEHVTELIDDLALAETLLGHRLACSLEERSELVLENLNLVELNTDLPVGRPAAWRPAPGDVQRRCSELGLPANVALLARSCAQVLEPAA
jgi:DNA polymerase-1